MFPGDYLPTVYCEDRVAADEAQRLARLQQEHMAKQAQKVAKLPSSQSSQTLSQPTPVSASSSGLLGSFVQGLMPGFGSRSAATSPYSSQSSTPAPTPRGEKSAASLSEEMERVIAERKRDADICAMPVW